MLIPSDLLLFAGAPDGPSGVTVEAVGRQGISRFFYWIGTHFPIGVVFTGPFLIRNAPDTLNASNFVLVSWPALVGAQSYDLLRTTTNLFPTIPTNFAVATGLTTTTFNDTGAALQAYDPTQFPASPVQCNINLNNRDFSKPTVNIGSCQVRVSSILFPDGSSQSTASGGGPGTPFYGPWTQTMLGGGQALSGVGPITGNNATFSGNLITGGLAVTSSATIGGNGLVVTSTAGIDSFGPISTGVEVNTPVIGSPTGTLLIGSPTSNPGSINLRGTAPQILINGVPFGGTGAPFYGPWTQTMQGGNQELVNVGRVGIGITTPTSPLHISTSLAGIGTATSPMVLMNNTGSGDIILMIGNSLKQYSIGMQGTGINSANPFLYIRDVTSGQYRAIFTFGGSVILGAQNPGDAPGSFAVANATIPIINCRSSLLGTDARFCLSNSNAGTSAFTIGLGSTTQSTVAPNLMYIAFNGTATNNTQAANQYMMIFDMALNTKITGKVGLGTSFTTGGTTPAHLLQLDTDDAVKPTTNTWSTTCDTRTKKNIRGLEGGLTVIEKLDPIVSEYNGMYGTPIDKRVVSLDPSKVKTLIPNAVTAIGKDSVMTLNTHEIFYHMLLAIKQLSERIKSLEGYTPKAEPPKEEKKSRLWHSQTKNPQR